MPWWPPLFLSSPCPRSPRSHLQLSAFPCPPQHSSFFYALWAAGAAIAAALLGTGARPASWGGAVALMACFGAPVAIMLPSSVTFMAHIMEKVGRAVCGAFMCFLLKVCAQEKMHVPLLLSPHSLCPAGLAPSLPAALSPLHFRALTARPAPPSVPLPHRWAWLARRQASWACYLLTWQWEGWQVPPRSSAWEPSPPTWRARWAGAAGALWSPPCC